MLKENQKLAIYMEENLDSCHGKMGFGIMRYSKNPITCVIDSNFSGKQVSEAIDLPFDIPVVASVEAALKLGAEVLVLGIAPTGGQVPDEWWIPLNYAINQGMSLINGLHDNLNNHYANCLQPGQWIWDVRRPQVTPEIACGRAASLNNNRVLFVGTDMAIGKMTVGLEVYKYLTENHAHIKSDFLATGQIGITIMGKGIPLDAFKVDHACGAVEQMVMQSQDQDIVLIEGQGSLLHPGSTATLPLMRGSCPTHLVLCHKAGMEVLRKPMHIKIPSIKEFIELNEALTHVCGSMQRAKTIGIALNTAHLNNQAAIFSCKNLEDKTGLPVTDVIRFGAKKLVCALLKNNG